MTVALALLAYAVLLCTAGASVLRRARWATRAPRLAIVAWLTVVWSAAAAIVLGGVGVTLSAGQVSGGVAEFLRSCPVALRHEYAVPGGATAGAVGAVVAILVVLRLAYCVAVAVVRASWQRRAHLRMLTMVGRHDPSLGALVVEHQVPAVYCLPGGRRERVVVTSGALGTLGGDELAAVLAHERAHLRGRHHLLVAVAVGLGDAVPWVPAFRIAAVEIGRLVEMVADDAAARSCARRTVAEALVAVAGGAGVPASALAAGGSSVADRVRRLLGSVRPLSWRQRAAAVVAAGALLTMPVLVAAAPAVVVSETGACHGYAHVHDLPHLHQHD